MRVDLFVYGPLKENQGRPATIYGTLYDFGAFLGAKQVGEVAVGSIPGTVVELQPGDLEQFDSHMGVDRGLYRRVRTLTAENEIVWVYEFAQDVGAFPQIASRDPRP